MWMVALLLIVAVVCLAVGFFAGVNQSAKLREPFDRSTAVDQLAAAQRALDEAAALRRHPFVPVPGASVAVMGDASICQVCGGCPSATVHDA